jgi:hypothetical protein
MSRVVAAPGSECCGLRLAKVSGSRIGEDGKEQTGTLVAVLAEELVFLDESSSSHVEAYKLWKKECLFCSAGIRPVIAKERSSALFPALILFAPPSTVTITPSRSSIPRHLRPNRERQHSKPSMHPSLGKQGAGAGYAKDKVCGGGRGDGWADQTGKCSATRQCEAAGPCFRWGIDALAAGEN